MSPEKPIRGKPELTKDTAPIAVSLRDITDNKARGRLRAASIVDAIKASLTKWVDSDGWTYEFENLPRVTISEKDIERAASTVDLKVWDASNTLIFRDRIHAWDGFPVLVPDGTQRQEILDTGEINLVDNFKEDPVEAVKTDLAHTVRVVTKTGTVPWVKDKPGTVSTFYGLETDGRIVSSGANYSTARSGGSPYAFPTDTTANWAFGQYYNGDYICYQFALAFDTSAIGSSATITAATLSISGYSDSDLLGGWNVEARQNTWGSGSNVASEDCLDGDTAGSKTRLATFAANSWATGGTYNDFTEDGSNLQSNINKTGSTEMVLVSSRFVAGNTPTDAEFLGCYTANQTGTTNDPKLVVTYTIPNTAPTITAGPTTTYASGTCTTPTVTWGVTFTATDSEQTGANALTYYIRTSSTFGAGTQVATGTCTSGASKAVTGLAYNASGVVEGTQTLYLHIYDGALNTVTASSFTLRRRFIRSTAGTGGTLSGALSRAPIYGKAIAGAISSISGALSRITNKSTSGVAGTLSGSLAALRTFFKELTGSISNTSGSISKNTSKALSGAPASMSALLSKATAKVLSGAAGGVSATLSSIKVQFISLSGDIASVTGSLVANTTYARAIAGELLSLTGNVSRMTLKALSGASGAVSGVLSSTRLFSMAIAGEIATVSGSVTRFVTKSFFGTITGSGILSTAASFYRTVTGSLSSLSGAFSFRSTIRRAKIKGGSVVRSVISGGSRRLR